MNCISLTVDQATVLDLLARRRPIPEDLTDTVEELRRWGWVMPHADELTGTGWSHAGGVGRGVLGM